MKRSIVILMAALLAAVLVAGAAFAADGSQSKTASTTGAKATCTLGAPDPDLDEHPVRLSCAVSDTAADGHAVFVEYWLDGQRRGRFSNTDGAGSTVTKDITFLFSGSSLAEVNRRMKALRWKVCRNASAPNCSDVVGF